MELLLLLVEELASVALKILQTVSLSSCSLPALDSIPRLELALLAGEVVLYLTQNFLLLKNTLIIYMVLTMGLIFTV